MSETSNERADAIVLELFDKRAGRMNPYPLYHQLREIDPVHRSSKGMWLLTRWPSGSHTLLAVGILDAHQNRNPLDRSLDREHFARADQDRRGTPLAHVRGVQRQCLPT